MRPRLLAPRLLVPGLIALALLAGSCGEPILELGYCGDGRQCLVGLECIGGLCMQPDSPCLNFNRCALEGLCTVGADDECFAGSDLECSQSETCTQVAACFAEAGVCVPGPMSGLCDIPMGHHLINPCQRDGRCHGVDGRCVATTDADCKASSGCKELGFCTHQGNGCVVGPSDCRGTTKCAEFGWCTFDGDRCIVGSDDDCLDSSGCAALGHCSLRHRVCKARSDEDCARSSRCQNGGRCIASEGECL
ncbi:MAG: hypothetical protein ACI9WU_002821 [Myxococcota bacterium]|jgi:hypothetical protein